MNSLAYGVWCVPCAMCHVSRAVCPVCQSWSVCVRACACVDACVSLVSTSISTGRLNEPPLDDVTVLKIDLLRLAAVWHHGGWWLDADIYCLDPIGALFASPEMRAALANASASTAVHCVFAWEGDIDSPPSAPLQWAFGCAASHPFLLHAMRLLAHRVLAFKPRAYRQPDPFAAPVHTAAGTVYVPVLRLSGPALVRDALSSYARGSPLPKVPRPSADPLRKLRVQAGERAADPSTWDHVTTVTRSGGADSEAVLLLPYCFFRSRGCPHLHANHSALADRVLFHHEFDTSWRPSYWHNEVTPEVEAHASPTSSPTGEEQTLADRLWLAPSKEELR